MLKFLVLADLHYFKDVYHAPVESLEKIMARADEAEVDFVVHLGDFSNHYVDSPEIVRPFTENPYGLPVYGVYGNHELEKSGDIAFVNAALTNQPVTFGREEDVGETGYWYHDVKGYRLVGLDTNYMYHEGEDRWYHNSAETWPFVPGTKLPLSLGRAQLAWLRETLRDASEKGLPVIVFTHVDFTGQWHSSPDAEKVREIFAEFPGTVKMAINGHHHTDRFMILDGIAYFDVNAVHNGYWWPHKEHHYTTEQTYVYTRYDHGLRLETYARPLTELRQAKNTWFFTEPTSAVVTLTERGTETDIEIEGCETAWMYGVLPPTDSDAVYPGIRSRKATV